MMGVLTPPIGKTSTCLTLPSPVLTQGGETTSRGGQMKSLPTQSRLADDNVHSMKNVAILPIVVALVVGPISGCSASASLGASGSPSISSAVSSVAPEQSPSSLASASRASAPSVIALIPGFKVTDNSGYSFS